MKCPDCHQECSEKDFLKRDRCYRCIYKEKAKNLSVIKKKKNPHLPFCKICNEPITNSERFVYCGEQCSNKANSIKLKNYWTRTLKVEGMPW